MLSIRKGCRHVPQNAFSILGVLNSGSAVVSQGAGAISSLLSAITYMMHLAH